MHANDVQNARQMIVADEKRYKDELWGELLAEAKHREEEKHDGTDKRSMGKTGLQQRHQKTA